ncbi:MAG: outer membrane protein transport protein [Candidatus Omnitrophica bacterium]|nr:outer membrane protein transport protein [Candidatus Omnitrophota bacterium]
MKKHLYLLVFAITLSALFCLNSDVLALGGGGFRNEAALDAEALGKGQAFVAQADSPSAVHFNPAGLVQLKDSHVRIGYTLEAPRQSFTNLSGGKSQMQKQSFLIPHLYYATDLGLEKWRFGFGMTSPYGLGTDWANDSFSAYRATESDLEISQANPTVAYKISDTISIGAGVDYVNSHVSKYKRLSALAGDGEFQLKGSDDALGYNIGLLIRPSDRHSLGFSYRSKAELNYKGKASMTNLSAGAYGPPLFPDNYSTDIESKMTIPRSMAAGYAYRPNDRWVFEVDVEWTGWSCIEEDYVEFTTETNQTRLAVLHDGNPAAKDWEDSLGWGFGAEYKASDKLELRGGYLFVESPIPSANFDTALPDSDKHNFTLGMGYDLSDSLTIDAAYEYVKLVKRKVTNDVAIATSDLDGYYNGYINIVAVSLTYKY